MSRYMDKLQDDSYHEEIANMDECRWLYNDVCCNSESDIVADFPSEDECRSCPHFEKEDGVIG